MHLIREVPGSYLDPEAVQPSTDISQFFSVHPDKCHKRPLKADRGGFLPVHRLQIAISFEVKEFNNFVKRC
jgi:hypothetical protein